MSESEADRHYRLMEAAAGVVESNADGQAGYVCLTSGSPSTRGSKSNLSQGISHCRSAGSRGSFDPQIGNPSLVEMTPKP